MPIPMKIWTLLSTLLSSKRVMQTLRRRDQFTKPTTLQWTKTFRKLLKLTKLRPRSRSRSEDHKNRAKHSRLCPPNTRCSTTSLPRIQNERHRLLDCQVKIDE